jgi:hypothetical protein
LRRHQTRASSLGEASQTLYPQPPASTLQPLFMAALLFAFFLFPMASRAAESTLPDWAPKPPPRVIEDRFRVEVLLLGANLDTTLRVDESLSDPGDVISAEDDLGLEDSQLLPQAEITLLPGERHLVRLSGLSSHRSAQQVLDRDIEFDDEVYLTGERVDSTLNLTMFGLTYGYRFLLRDNAELTGTLGIQITEVEANAVVRSRVVRDAESGVAPLPLLGLEGRYDFNDSWSAEARVQYLTANIDDVEGDMLDARAAVTWRMNPYLVFGLGYRTFSMDVDSRDQDTPGLVDMTMDGPVLFMRASL